MANLTEANDARARHAAKLAKQGAHAVGVEKGASFGKRGWVVVAYVEPGNSVRLEDSLTTTVKGKAVPLMVETAERFEPQE